MGERPRAMLLNETGEPAVSYLFGKLEAMIIRRKAIADPTDADRATLSELVGARQWLLSLKEG